MRIVLLACLVAASGCATAGKVTGVALTTAGLAMATTGTILAAGCEHTNPGPPPSSSRGSCLPDDRYDRAKPYVITSVALGAVMTVTGLVVHRAATSPD